MVDPTNSKQLCKQITISNKSQINNKYEINHKCAQVEDICQLVSTRVMTTRHGKHEQIPW